MHYRFNQNSSMRKRSLLSNRGIQRYDQIGIQRDDKIHLIEKILLWISSIFGGIS